jgi:hypothetical protein
MKSVVRVIYGDDAGCRPAFAQTESSTDTNMILMQKLKADKKPLVAANMELTDAESKGLLAVVRRVPKRSSKSE